MKDLLKSKSNLSNLESAETIMEKVHALTPPSVSEPNTETGNREKANINLQMKIDIAIAIKTHCVKKGLSQTAYILKIIKEDLKKLGYIIE